MKFKTLKRLVNNKLYDSFDAQTRALILAAMEHYSPLRERMTGDKVITPEQFGIATGRMPKQDDLERINCKHAGDVGHWNCGWCTFCNQPVMSCGHRREMPTNPKETEE